MVFLGRLVLQAVDRLACHALRLRTARPAVVAVQAAGALIAPRTSLPCRAVVGPVRPAAPDRRTTALASRLARTVRVAVDARRQTNGRLSAVARAVQVPRRAGHRRPVGPKLADARPAVAPVGRLGVVRLLALARVPAAVVQLRSADQTAAAQVAPPRRRPPFAPEPSTTTAVRERSVVPTPRL